MGRLGDSLGFLPGDSIALWIPCAPENGTGVEDHGQRCLARQEQPFLRVSQRPRSYKMSFSLLCASEDPDALGCPGHEPLVASWEGGVMNNRRDQEDVGREGREAGSKRESRHMNKYFSSFPEARHGACDLGGSE